MASGNLSGHDAATSFGNPSPHTRAAHLIVGGLLLLAMALSAFFMVKHLSALSRRASGQAMAGKVAAELLQRHMHGELLGITRTLGEENGAMKAAVTGRLEPDAPEVMAALSRIRRTTRATIVYILNAQGDTVACTPYDGGQTLTGKNYAFRPYFRTAVNGRDVVYPALGITTQKRGLYFSSPIRASGEEREGGAAIGVVVIKKGLEEVDAFFGSLGQPAALLSPEGVVFAGNRSDWLLHPFFPAEEKEADERQFGSNEQKSLDTVVRPGEQPFQVLAGDRPYDMFISELRLPNSEGTWRLVLLEDLSTLLPGWFQTAVFIVSLTGLCAFAVGCVSLGRRQGHSQTLADNMLAATAVAGLGSLCFLAIYVVVEKWEGNRLTTIFVNKAEVTASLLSSGIKDYLDEIDTLTHFAATVPTLDQEHLAGFAGPLLARKPGIASVFWAPRQENEPSRADHFPVAQRLPPAAQSFALGVDLAADERLASLFGAVGDDSLADMNLIPIKDEDGRGHVWMAAVAPVPAKPRTAPARPTAASSPAGLMVGVLDMAQALDNIFSNHPRQGMDLRVTDLAAGGEPLPLYSSGSPDPSSGSSPSSSDGRWWAPLHLEHRVSMRAADRHWEFVATGGAEFIDLHRNRYGSFILIVGAMLTLLAAWYVVSSARRRQQVESLVENRTAQLAESENRISTILESIQAGVMIIDSAGKTIEYVNRAAAQMAGREKEELKGQVCHQLICPSRQGQCPIADQCQTVENAEGLLIRKDGSSMPVVKTVKPITYKGRECCIETFVDITALTRAQEALSHSERNYRLLFESATDAVLLFADNAISDANQTALDMFGYRLRDQLIGRHPADLSPAVQPCGTDSQVLARQRLTAALQQKSIRFDWLHQRQDGETFPAEVILKTLELGERRVIQVVIRDISERKAHDDRLAETLQELERFNKVMLAREGRVLELKAEVNALLVELDRKPVYRTAGAA